MPALTEVRDLGPNCSSPAIATQALPRLKAGATMEEGSVMSV